MKFFIILDEDKDKDLIDWLNSIDKEARKYILKMTLRQNLGFKTEPHKINLAKKENNLDDKTENKIGNKLDRMF